MTNRKLAGNGEPQTGSIYANIPEIGPNHFPIENDKPEVNRKWRDPKPEVIGKMKGITFLLKNGKPEVNRKWGEPNRKKYANVFVEGGGRNGGNKSTVSGMIPSQVLRITAGVEYLPLIISAGYSVINTRHAAKRGRGNK